MFIKNDITNIEDHLSNAEYIIKTLSEGQNHRTFQSKEETSDLLQIPGIKEYQKFLCEFKDFARIINMMPHDGISKVKSGWLLINDRRPQIATEINNVILKHGIGIGMMVLHLQQMNSNHIPLKIEINKTLYDLTKSTKVLYGANGEQVVYIPIRKFRSDFKTLAELNIVKPEKFWDRQNILSHEHDRFPCFYCSSHEMNPNEVVVNIEGSRFNLSRNYSLGFTFAPFGNPINVTHFLAWDCSKKPLNMNRTPMTVSDLVELTKQINNSIKFFFAGTGIEDFPIINGVSNGWAGNSIYHQHFQFFSPESKLPISNNKLITNEPILDRDDVEIHKLSWKTPVYKIIAKDSITAGLVGNDMAGIWRLLGGSKKVGYKEFPDGFQVKDDDKVPVNTQNIIVPGEDNGRTIYILLRDKRLVNYISGGSHDFINIQKGIKPQNKENIGVLEASGTLLVDDLETFHEMRIWDSADISEQINRIAEAIKPEVDKITQFENSIKELFFQ